MKNKILPLTAVWQNGGFSAKFNSSSTIELLRKTEHLCFDFRHFAKLQNVVCNLKKMKPSISKNKKTSTILNKLIENGFYKGIIDDDKFELTGTYPNHLKITGKLNDKENFELNIKHHFAIIYLTRFFFLFGTIFSILYSINGIWIPFFFLTILSIFVLLGSKYAEKKAITQFLEKFFEIEKREFER